MRDFQGSAHGSRYYTTKTMISATPASHSLNMPLAAISFDEVVVDHAEPGELVPPHVLQDVLGVRVRRRRLRRHPLEHSVEVLRATWVTLDFFVW